MASQDYVRLTEHKSCSEINIYSTLTVYSVLPYHPSHSKQRHPMRQLHCVQKKHLNHPCHDRIKTTHTASQSTNVDSSPWSKWSIKTPMIYMCLSGQYFLAVQFSIFVVLNVLQHFLTQVNKSKSQSWG